MVLCLQNDMEIATQDAKVLAGKCGLRDGTE